MTAFAALSHAGLRALWSGVATLMIAGEIFRIAALWLVVGGDPGAVAWVSGVQSAVMIVAVLAGAGLGERTRGGLRGILVVFALVEAAAMAALAVPAVVDGGNTAPLWAVLAAVIAVTLAQAQWDPTAQAALPRVVRDERDLLRGNGLLDGTRRIARLVGPSVAAGLLLLLPLAGALPVAAALSALGALAFARLPPLGTTDRSAPSPRLGALVEAARIILRLPDLRIHLALSIVMNVVWIAGPVLGWTLMLAHLHGAAEGAVRYGVLVAAYAVSNIVVNVAAASAGRPPSLGVAVLVQLAFGAGVAASGVAGMVDAPWPVFVATAVLAGAGPPIADLRLAWRLQTGLPAALVGAGFRLRIAWAWAAMAAGSALTGLSVSDEPMWLPVGAGGVAMVACLLALPAAFASDAESHGRRAEPDRPNPA